MVNAPSDKDPRWRSGLEPSVACRSSRAAIKPIGPLKGLRVRATQLEGAAEGVH